jgi:membrane protease YdiL (CAAX protease family)
MEEQDSVTKPRSRVWLDRAQALFEVFLVSGVLSSFIASLPFAIYSHGSGISLKSARVVAGFVLLEAAITLLLLSLILKAHGEKLSDLGLRWARWKSELPIGIATVPFLFLLNGVVGVLFKYFLPRFFSEHNPLVEIIHAPQDLVLFIFAGLLAGGIKEELQRAFVLERFRVHLGGAWFGLAVWSIAFGAGHYIQGVQGTVVAGLLGFVFGVIYLVRKNLIAPMVSHGLYDTAALLGYWFFRSVIQT